MTEAEKGRRKKKIRRKIMEMDDEGRVKIEEMKKEEDRPRDSEC